MQTTIDRQQYDRLDTHLQQLYITEGHIAAERLLDTVFQRRNCIHIHVLRAVRRIGLQNRRIDQGAAAAAAVSLSCHGYPRQQEGYDCSGRGHDYSFKLALTARSWLSKLSPLLVSPVSLSLSLSSRSAAPRGMFEVLGFQFCRAGGTNISEWN